MTTRYNWLVCTFCVVLVTPGLANERGWSKKGGDAVTSASVDGGMSHYTTMGASSLDSMMSFDQDDRVDCLGDIPLNAAGIPITADKIKSSPLITQFSEDKFKSVVVTSNDQHLYIYNHDGTLRAGYPRYLGFSGNAVASPAAGDVDGDGNTEVVVIGIDINDPKLCRIKIISPDMPPVSDEVTYTFSQMVDPAAPSTTVHASLNGTPCIIDIEKTINNAPHPAEEILIRDGMGRVHIIKWDDAQQSFYNYTGSNDPGLSENMATSPDPVDQDLYGRHLQSPGISAFEVDQNEASIIVPSTNGVIYKFQVNPEDFSASLTQPRSQFAPSAHTAFYGSASVANLMGGDQPYIVACSMEGEIFVLTKELSLKSGQWPKQLPAPIISSPIAVNLDNDTDLEIVVGCMDNKVYAFEHDGTEVPGWPVSTAGEVFGGIVSGELDGEPGLEIVATSQDGFLYIWHHNGQPMNGWPKRLDTPIEGAAALADLRNTGRMSVIACGFDGRIFVFDLANKSLNTSAGWPQLGGGDRRRGGN